MGIHLRLRDKDQEIKFCSPLDPRQATDLMTYNSGKSSPTCWRGMSAREKKENKSPRPYRTYGTEGGEEGLRGQHSPLMGNTQHLRARRIILILMILMLMLALIRDKERHITHASKSENKCRIHHPLRMEEESTKGGPEAMKRAKRVTRGR